MVGVMLTGKTRHRKTIFGKMVLQVEHCYGLPGANKKAREKTGLSVWEDASEGDVLELMAMGAIPYCYTPPLPPETNQA